MDYSTLNNYLYPNKSLFLTACDYLSAPLRVALGGKTIHYLSGKEESVNRIQAIALCCLIVPSIVGAVCLFLKKISSEIKALDDLTKKVNSSFPEYSSQSNSRSALSDQPFVFAYLPKHLTITLKPLISSEVIAQNLIEDIFTEILNQTPSKKHTLYCNRNGQFFIQYEKEHRRLQEVLEGIKWNDLEHCWLGLTSEETAKFTQNSLLFEKLRSHSNTSSPFSKSHPFLYLYTSCGLYSPMNTLLRKGELKTGRFHYASEETNLRLAEQDPATTYRVVKEILFISLLASGSLSLLPDKYLETHPVIRIAHVPKAVLKIMKEGEVIAERSFLSASGKGGGFAGGGPCDEPSVRVKYVIRPKTGKRVQEFSDLPENEVLFRPFTQFKIIKIIGSEDTGFRIEMEEISTSSTI